MLRIKNWHKASAYNGAKFLVANLLVTPIGIQFGIITLTTSMHCLIHMHALCFMIIINYFGVTTSHPFGGLA